MDGDGAREPLRSFMTYFRKYFCGVRGEDWRGHARCEFQIFKGLDDVKWNRNSSLTVKIAGREEVICLML